MFNQEEELRKKKKNIRLLFAGGGLGNQMFQYAYARYVQIKFHGTLQLNISAFQKEKREYALQNFSIPEDITICSPILGKAETLFFRFRRRWIYFLYKKKKKHPEQLYQISSQKGIFSGIDSYTYYPCSQKCRSRTIYVFGLFQSIKYFAPIKDIIQKELQVGTPVMEKNKKILQEICSKNSVCVHIRRGDYLESPWKEKLDLCTERYYREAMDLMEQKKENPVFYIFSNTSKDLAWIKEHYQFKKNVVYVDQGNPDFEELRLMYSCRHFILSNSSFSWWAQFLGTAQDKLVIAPDSWIRGEACEDVFMKEWLRIKV